MAEEQGLPELLDSLRWRWKLTALVAVCFLAGAVFYVESLPAIYEAEAVVALSPDPDEENSGAEEVRLKAPTYVRIVTAPITVRRVARLSGLEASELADGLDAAVEADTGNVTITVRLESAEEAAAAANGFADEAVDFAENNDRLLTGTLVAEAVVPRSPAAPPRRLLQAASLVVGILLGIAVSFVVERGRPRLRSWREMAKMTGYPVVGRIPSSRALRARPEEAFADPGIGAAFRTLRTNLEREWQDRTVDTIMVTSPNAADGKTTVAALFSESLARLGVEVLLIDADLRRPGLARTFKLDVGEGLAGVLREKTELSEAVQPGWVNGLWVLPTTADPDAGDLLARRFPDVLREAREKYDIVICDTPPLLGTDDSRTLATMMAGVLVVISARSPAGPVNEAVLSLETLKAAVLGVVGNRLREPKRSYYA